MGEGERESVKMEGMDDVRDGFGKEEEKQGHVSNKVAQTEKLVQNAVSLEHGQQEGEELSTLVTSCLLKVPRVLIRRLEIVNISFPVSSPPLPVACKRGQGMRSPRKQDERHMQKGQVTQKRETVGQLVRPMKLLPSSSENG